MPRLEVPQVGLRLNVSESGGCELAALRQAIRLENLVVNLKILIVRSGGPGRAGQDEKKRHDCNPFHNLQVLGKRTGGYYRNCPAESSAIICQINIHNVHATK
jgi:hypothetical protein